MVICMTENIFYEVGKTIRNPKSEYERKDELFEILLKNKLCGIKIVGIYNGKKGPAKLPKKNRGIARLTYILTKWYHQQLNGGGITEYILGEERTTSLLNEKITHIH